MISEPSLFPTLFTAGSLVLLVNGIHYEVLLAGLVMIAWTTSFSFLEMQSY